MGKSCNLCHHRAHFNVILHISDAYRSSSSALERIDNRITTIDDFLQRAATDVCSKMETLQLSDEERGRIISNLRDVTDPNQSTADADMRLLLKICSGIQKGIEKLCHDSSDSARNHASLFVSIREHTSGKSSLSLISNILKYVKDVKLALSRLTYMFREFSLEVRRCFTRILDLSLEIRSLLE